MKKRYYVIIFLIIFIECLPLIMAFFDTSVKTDCIIVRLVLVGWLLLVGILLSCYITDTWVHKKPK